MKEKDEDFFNPIDPDKVAENPGMLPYAHHVGGVAIRPDDVGKIKSKAMSAMEQQTQMQLSQIQEQIELLAQQAKRITDRLEVSRQIYSAKINFEPVIGNIYFLYLDKSDRHVVSMIGPKEWGRSKPFKQFIAAVELLSDHTWKVISLDS